MGSQRVRHELVIDHAHTHTHILINIYIYTLPVSHCKESACNARDSGLSPGLGRSPGEGNATHSSILARRFPWTEETVGLQSMGLQRVGHN